MSLIFSSLNSGFNSKQSSMSFYNKVTTLPRIPHPSTLTDDQDKYSLDIQGKSTDEYQNTNQRSNSHLSNNSRRSSSFNYSNQQQIPENINVIYGQDRDKLRLPIFGRRASTVLSSSSQIPSGKSTQRIEIVELESILKEKVRSQLHDIRIKFRHCADFDSNGKISRQAFKHVIASIFGTQRQISPNQIDQLLEKLHLKEFTRISFDEFLKCLSLNETNSSNRQSSPPEEFLIKRTAGQMFIILKDKLRRKDDSLVRLCPSLDGGSPSTIFKSQFHDTLIDMGFRMKDKEFDKLWDKFDRDGFHVINSQKFLKRLTNEDLLNESSLTGRSESQDQQSSILKSSFMKSFNKDSQMKSSSQNSYRNQLDTNQIERWFNDKLKQCLSQLEQSFQRLDTKQSGTLSPDQFIHQLKQFGLVLEENLLDAFFKYLNLDLTLTDQTIPYEYVIKAFKQRIDSTKQVNEFINPLQKEEIVQSSLEKQIEYLISLKKKDIEEKMIRLDRNKDDRITIKDMRSIIEDLLEFPLRHDEYHLLIKQFPQDQYGYIKYKDYLKQIPNQINAEKEEEQKSFIEQIPKWDYMRSNNIRESLRQENIQNNKLQKSIHSYENDQLNQRSFQQLSQILQIVIENRWKDIENEFAKLDYGSYGELTKTLLYKLFQRLDLQPEITTKEIELLWSHCHLKQNGTLDFYQFLRQFGYSKDSSHYPNSKQNPPQRGDKDFLLTSNKLHSNSILIHETLRHSIKANWDQLRQQFTQLDPTRHGFIQSQEFDQILTRFCPSVNQQDLTIIKSTFQTQNHSRINYVQFLKHHSPTGEFIDEIDQSTRIPINSIHPSSDRSLLNDVSSKLRRKLSDDYKSLRRSFKEEDRTNSGSVSIQVLKDILNQFKCPLNDEQFYVLISEIDTNLNGTINYNYFLQQYIKNT